MDYGTSFSLLGERPDFGRDLPAIQGLPVGSGTPTAVPDLGEPPASNDRFDPIEPGPVGAYPSPGAPGVGTPMPMSAPPVDPRLAEALDAIRTQRKELEGLSFWDRTLRNIPQDQNARNIAGLAQQEVNLQHQARSGQLYERQVNAQEERNRLTWAKGVAETLGVFANMDTETKQLLGPVYGPVIRTLLKDKGIDMPNNLFAALVSKPGAAEAAAEIFLGDEYSPTEKQNYIAQFRRLKPEQIPAFMDKVQKDKAQRMQDEIVPQLPGIVRSIKEEEIRKGNPQVKLDQPLPAPILMQYAAEHPQFATSRTFRRALTALMATKEGQDILTNSGVESAVEARKRLEGAGKPSETSKELLKSLMSEIIMDPEFAKRGFKSVDDIPAGEITAFAQRAQLRHREKALNDAKTRAHDNTQAAKTAALEVENAKMISQSDFYMKGGRYRDKETGDELDPMLSVGEVKSRGKSVATMTPKMEEAYRAAQETKGLLLPWYEAATKMATRPGENFKNGLVNYGKTALGIPNPLVELQALEGSVLRLAGAMQGSRAQLSDNDRKAVEKMVAGMWDSRQTAVQRLDVFRKIVENMEDTELGRMTPQELSRRVQEAARAAGEVKVIGKTRIK